MKLPASCPKVVRPEFRQVLDTQSCPRGVQPEAEIRPNVGKHWPILARPGSALGNVCPKFDKGYRQVCRLWPILRKIRPQLADSGLTFVDVGQLRQIDDPKQPSLVEPCPMPAQMLPELATIAQSWSQVAQCWSNSAKIGKRLANVDQSGQCLPDISRSWPNLGRVSVHGATVRHRLGTRLATLGQLRSEAGLDKVTLRSALRATCGRRAGSCNNSAIAGLYTRPPTLPFALRKPHAVRTTFRTLRGPACYDARLAPRSASRRHSAGAGRAVMAKTTDGLEAVAGMGQVKGRSGAPGR